MDFFQEMVRYKKNNVNNNVITSLKKMNNIVKDIWKIII